MEHEFAYITTPSLVWCLVPEKKLIKTLKAGIKLDQKNIFNIPGFRQHRVIYAVKSGDEVALERLKNIVKMTDPVVVVAAVPAFYKCIGEIPQSEMEKVQQSIDGPAYRGILIVPDGIRSQYIKGTANEIVVETAPSDNSEITNETNEDTAPKTVDELESELKALKTEYEQLFEENLTDIQTGCFNRKGFDHYKDDVVNEASADGKSLFVCVWDLNGLKHINDTYGHDAGDIAIMAITKAIKKSSPKDAKIIRTGGDEFLVIAAVDYDYDFNTAAEPIIQEFLNSYNKTSNNSFDVSASYGFVQVSGEDVHQDFNQLVKVADEKMYKMKVATDPYRRD